MIEVNAGRDNFDSLAYVVRLQVEFTGEDKMHFLAFLAALNKPNQVSRGVEDFMALKFLLDSGMKHEFRFPAMGEDEIPL